MWGSAWPAPAGKIQEKLQCIWLSMCGVSSHNKARIFFLLKTLGSFFHTFYYLLICKYYDHCYAYKSRVLQPVGMQQRGCSASWEGTLKIFLVISSGEAGGTGVVSCWVKVSVYFLKGQLNIFLDSIDLQCNLRSQYLQASFLYPPPQKVYMSSGFETFKDKKSRIETPKLGNL